MFKHFFKKSNDDDIFETVDPIVEQRRNEKFSKPLIYDEEFKKEKVTKKSEGQQVPKETTSKNVKKVEKKVEKKEEPEIKKNYEMMDIISPMFGMHEEKKEIVKTVKKNSVKKSKKKDNSLIQVISPYYGNFEEKVVEEESEAILTSANEETEETIENIEESETTETVEDEEEKLPTVEDNLRNIANIVKEEQDQLKIIEERTGEFKLDFGANKDEEKTTLIDEIDDNMSLDELMSLYEKKFKD